MNASLRLSFFLLSGRAPLGRNSAQANAMPPPWAGAQQAMAGRCGLGEGSSSGGKSEAQKAAGWLKGWKRRRKVSGALDDCPPRRTLR